MYRIYTAFVEFKFLKSRHGSLKPLLKVKLITIILLNAFIYVHASGNAQTVSLSVRNSNLKEVFRLLREQTGYGFLYREADLKRTRPVTLHVRNAPLTKVLDQCLADQLLTYHIDKNLVIIKRKSVNRAPPPKPEMKHRVSGRVTDQNRQPLVGVSVTIKNGSGATMTDNTGRYQIDADIGDSLIFTYVGYRTQTIVVSNKTQLNVVLQLQETALDEVVVTALGIRREEKSLGYSAQTVKENAVKDAKTNNWVNSLNGKIPGLNIQSAGTGPLGSSRITLRGESSLNLDDNQALIVIDGVPVSNKITGTGFSSYLGSDNAIDFGSDVSDLNPDDIETVTVLKGPGATALYGSRAAGGALIITTKSGANAKGLGITYNVNASIDQVNRWPDYQFEYGEGRKADYFSYLDSEDGPNTATDVAAGRAWGPRFEGQLYYQFNPDAPDGKPVERTPWVANKNYISDFFRTGFTLSNSIAIEGGGEKGSGRLSLTHLKNEWILPNTGFERSNVSLSFNQKVTRKLKISGKVNYTNKRSDNLPAAGYNNQSIMYFLILGALPNIRSEWYKPYWKPGLENVEQRNPFNPGPDNPYLDLYEMLNKMNKHGIVGSANATYAFNDHLELMLRSGLDMSFEYRSQQRPFSMTKYPRGMFREQNVFNYELNTDLLLTYKNRLSDDFRYRISGGANAMKQRYDFAGIYADQLAQPGVYQISNSLDQAVADPQHMQKAINSVYAYGQISYRDKIFLDLTGRNDWSSTLPFENNSFFYPSVSSSFILSDLFQLPAQVSFAKLRLSWAQVGNDTRPYQTSKYYDRIYSNSFTNPSVLFNPDLKPEITSSFEAGIDARFFRSRLGIDVAVYTNNSRNQILATPIDPVSGYSRALVNAGLINSRGAEVALTVKPIVRKDFSWTTVLNWSTNRSYVKKLAEGITSQVIYKHAEGVTIEAREGGRMGDLYGNGFQRSPEGKIIYSSVGLPASLDPVVKKLGNAFADWKAGILNEVTVKRFRASILIDGQKGGSMFSQTNVKNNTLGKTKVTLPGREEGIIGDGVVFNPTTQQYEPNTVKVPASSYYTNYYKINNAETNIFDASFIKIREVRFEYSLPQDFLGRIGIRQTKVAVYGRELFNFTKFPAFDPEGGNLNNGTITPGVELTQFPSTRNMGINLTFKF
ncbi:SusC/RagA family TonB-linked outer membrane protein [Niabella terrae]